MPWIKSDPMPWIKSDSMPWMDELKSLLLTRFAGRLALRGPSPLAQVIQAGLQGQKGRTEVQCSPFIPLP